jgi:hypothetical protein
LAFSASEHKNPAEPGRKLGGAYMSIYLTDFVLFSGVVVLATGIVIAFAMLTLERQLRRLTGRGRHHACRRLS